jgi:hypothetical protein
MAKKLNFGQKSNFGKKIDFLSTLKRKKLESLYSFFDASLRSRID